MSPVTPISWCCLLEPRNVPSHSYQLMLPARTKKCPQLLLSADAACCNCCSCCHKPDDAWHKPDCCQCGILRARTANSEQERMWKEPGVLWLCQSVRKLASKARTLASSFSAGTGNVQMSMFPVEWRSGAVSQDHEHSRRHRRRLELINCALWRRANLFSDRRT